MLVLPLTLISKLRRSQSQRCVNNIINIWSASGSGSIRYSSNMSSNEGPSGTGGAPTAIETAKVTKRANSSKETRSDQIMKPSISSGTISLSAPIGHIKSCFKSKNGTPRQPTVCSYSRAKLRILKSVFVCPDHSLDGLAEFSHVWVLFVFHQNSQETFGKAKVKPPRLDGRKVGVFASRSPHRPNPIGLTLARLDKVEGDTLYLSGMDMIDGTPVLDIKPYVPAYDSPSQANLRTVDDRDPTKSSKESDTSLERPTPAGTCMKDGTNDDRYDLALESERSEENCRRDCSEGNVMDAKIMKTDAPEVSEAWIDSKRTESTDHSERTSEAGAAKRLRHAERDFTRTDEAVEASGKLTDSREDTEMSCKSCGDNKRSTEAETVVDDALSSDVRVAGWVSAPPIRRLAVRFTPCAEAQLAAFWQNEDKDCDDFKLEFLHDASEARCAIQDILSADPRSVYRRKDCTDRLYYFTLDNLHITSWFGPGFAEVLFVQPISQASVPTKTVDRFPSNDNDSEVKGTN